MRLVVSEQTYNELVGLMRREGDTTEHGDPLPLHGVEIVPRKRARSAYRHAYAAIEDD